MSAQKCVSMQRGIWRLALLVLLSLSGVGLAREPLVSRVVKLKHLAVILPEDTVRKKWDCDSWTPTVQQVTDAEKAVLLRLRQPEKVRRTADRPIIKYIIQYYGIVWKNQKWIACGVYKMSGLRDIVEYSGDSEDEFSTTMEMLFTYPYCEFDSEDWRGFYYHASAGKLLDPMDDPNEESPAPRSKDESPMSEERLKKSPTPVETEDPFKREDKSDGRTKKGK